MESKTTTQIVYWDSCIFIAWLKDEKRPVGEMDGVYDCVELVNKGDVRLITSVMTRTEVFEAELSESVRILYDNLLKRRNVQLIDQDLRVSNLSREIREYYQRKQRLDGIVTITAPDAVHLATAIHYKADAFYTFDDGNKGGRSLLSLDGNVADYKLHICKPPVGQTRIPLYTL